MARLEILNNAGEGGRRVIVTLSRRNLLTLLQKLDMPGSAREFHNNDCWEDGEQCPLFGGTTLVMRSEDDDEHYGRRAAPPGLMHPDSESFVAEHGGVPGVAFSLWHFGTIAEPQEDDDD